MTPEQVREIAENSARIAATDAAEKAVRATLIAPIICIKNSMVRAFARTVQQGTRRGAIGYFFSNRN